METEFKYGEDWAGREHQGNKLKEIFCQNKPINSICLLNQIEDLKFIFYLAVFILTEPNQIKELIGTKFCVATGRNRKILSRAKMLIFIILLN